MTSTFIRLLALAAMLSATVFGGACSGDDAPPSASAPAAATFDGSYGITAYVPEGESVRTLMFRQDIDVGAETGTSSGPLKTLDIGFDPDSGGALPQTIPTTSTSAMKDLARMALSECGLRGTGTMGTTAFATAQRTGSCVVKQLSTGQAYNRVAATAPTNVLPTQSAWVGTEEPSCLGLDTSSQPFLFFSFEPKTAAQILQYEETLVCAASKLAELAESDKPVRWVYGLYGLGATAVATNTSTSVVDLPGYNGDRSTDIIPQPVTFKVTQPKDRFLVRDLAMELLSYVPLLDQLPLQAGPQWRSASDIFSKAATSSLSFGSFATGSDAALAYNITTGTSTTAVTSKAAADLYYPPLVWNGTAVDWPKTARQHLEMETANLRAAEQLLKDLVEKNVYGALGGTMQKASQLSAAERANLMWQNANADGNSMSQVARDLFGRFGTLGMAASGGTVLNTNCAKDTRAGLTANWITPPDLWPAYAPYAFVSRGFDRRYRRRIGGARADGILAASKFAYLVPDGVPLADMRNDLFLAGRDVLAEQAGQSPTVYASSLPGLAFKAQVDGLTDQTMTTAFKRQTATFGALANTGVSPAAFSSLGITATLAGSGILQKYALSRPLARPDMTGDLMAYVGSLQMASECTGTQVNADFTTVGQVVLGDPTVNGSAVGRTAATPFTPRARSYQFQNAFAVGQAIRDRIVRLRDYAATVNTNNLGTAVDEDVKARSGALFEVDGWAGGGRAVLQPTSTGINLILHDVNPADFGLPDSPNQTQLINAFAMLVAPAFGTGDLVTYAQCASGTRTNKCPSNLANYLWKPTSATTNTSVTAGTTIAKQFGRLRKRFDIVFPATGVGVPTYISTKNTVVLAQLAKAVVRVKSGNFNGQVLGSSRSTSTIATTTANDFINNTATFPLSPLQRALMEKVFGFPNSSEDGSLADTREYCIPGVPRDIIVPLENELTNDSDGYESSWKHYLTLAKQASTKADELGRELVEIGTRIEERKEGASDRLEQATGGPFDKDCLDAQSGAERNFDKCSDAIKAITNSATIDVTLLTEDPLGGNLDASMASQTAGKAALTKFMSCDTLPASVKPPVCARLADPLTTLAVSKKDKNGAYSRPAMATASTIVYAALGLFKPAPVLENTIADCSLPTGRDPYTAPEDYLAPLTTDGRPRWSSDDDQLRQLIQQARLIVDNDANFRLESNGLVLADSRVQGTAPNQTANVWPGCLRTDVTTTPSTTIDQRCGFSAGSTNPNSAYNRVMNQLFRSCAGSNVGLGLCDAPNDAWAELNGIRWRLMGALWTASMLSGQVPEGMFDIPVPAVSFPGAFGSASASTCSLTSTAYLPGRFTVPNGSGESFPADTTEAADLQAMGRIEGVDTRFAAMPATASMPFWYRAIYDGGATTPPGIDPCFRTGTAGLSYRHLRTRNAHTISNVRLGLEDVGGAGTASRGITLNGWRALARLSQNHDPRIYGAVGMVKTNLDVSTPAGALYQARGNEDIHLAATRVGSELGPLAGESLPATYVWYIWHPVAANEHKRDTVWRDCPNGENYGLCTYGVAESRASIHPPAMRARFFANSLPPLDQGDAERQYGEGIGLSCALASAAVGSEDLESPPPITSEADLAAIERWLIAKQNSANRLLQRLQVENMPVQVLEAVATGTVGNGALKGQAGIAIIEAVTALRAVSSSYQEMVAAVTNARFEIAALRGRLRTFDAMQQVKNAQASIRAMENLRAAVSAIGGSFLQPGMIGGIASAEATGAIQMIDVTELQPAETKELDAQRQEAMMQASGRLVAHRKAQVDAINLVRDKSSMLQTRLLLIEQIRNQVKGDLEKATGSGAWSCKDPSGKDIVCRSYVNAVLNVRYSGTRVRYEQALTAARAAGYYARRAIEQRVGMRLDQIESNMGPLEAPVKWADRVCTMHGVDFDTLKRETVSTDPAEKRAWEDLRGREYANSFIGDYVDLLTQFMEQYNVSFPSQDGNDTLLASMREDVVRNKSACISPSLNRLRNSEMIALAEESAGAVDGVWQKHLCTTAKCLATSEWRVDSGIVAPAATRGAWLRTRPTFAGSSRAEGGIPFESGYVTQALVLPAGDYVFSFKDAALSPATGQPTTSTAQQPYRASVFDDAGRIVATGLFTPVPGVTAGPLVSPVLTQRSLSFSLANTGRYRVGFAAASFGVQESSFLLVDPQVERATATSPIAYQLTDGDGMTPSKNCASTSAELRAKFDRKCGDTPGARCYYELRDTINMDTQAQSVNGQSLAEKLAADNFNYRHMDLAVNLVGTGVRNCDENPTPACYASGTIEFDLIHEANQVGIEGYDKEARRFDFGEAAVRHGKALTAERYLTLPLSSADNGLLSQTGIVKTELRGRPLDGRYKLRIYESPALRWNRLEDIQLMVRYRYWSRITGNAP
jgi:hypothetical protein